MLISFLLKVKGEGSVKLFCENMNPIYRKCHRISFVNYFRNASTVSLKNDIVSQHVSENAKKFVDIPRMNRWEIILRFLPKGIILRLISYYYCQFFKE